MLQKLFISDKRCSFELSIFFFFFYCVMMMNPLRIIYNFTWATFAFEVVHANVQI